MANVLACGRLLTSIIRLKAELKYLLQDVDIKESLKEKKTSGVLKQKSDRKEIYYSRN